MLRKASFLAGVLFVGQVAFGQNTVHSFTRAVSNGDSMGTVPPGGFVLTDIVLYPATSDNLSFFEAHAKLYVTPRDADSAVSFQSGITFAPNSEILVSRPVGIQRITLIGYIPGPSTAGIPAVGGVGLGILIATIAAAGGWILSRRTGFTRAA